MSNAAYSSDTVPAPRMPRFHRRKQRRRGGPRRVPWPTVGPGILLLLAFEIVPIAAGSYYALTDWSGIGGARFVGLSNFRHIFMDTLARNALWHTLELAGTFFVAVNVAGLLLALALNRALKARYILRTLFLAPVIMSPLAVSYIWSYIFDYSGALNSALGSLGLASWKEAWLGDPRFALWSILVVMVWQFSGLAMVIYLAGLQRIPEELLEAAAVDGASAWMRFRRIVLPQLAPATTVCATLTLVLGLRVFDQVVALTNGGPDNATETLATQVWKQTFAYGRFGYGAALAVLMTVLIAVLVLGQLAVLRMREREV